MTTEYGKLTWQDVRDADKDRVVILNVSATAHMPDVLEVPYTPEIIDAGGPGEKAHTYILGVKQGNT